MNIDIFFNEMLEDVNKSMEKMNLLKIIGSLDNVSK